MFSLEESWTSPPPPALEEALDQVVAAESIGEADVNRRRDAYYPRLGGYRSAAQRLEIQVEQRLPVAVVALAGTLTLPAVARLRQVLVTCLTACPDALVVDLAGLHVDDDLLLAVFRAVNRHASAWPAVPLLLCAPAPQVTAWLARTGTAPTMSVHSSRSGAMAAAGRATSAARAEQDLLGSIHAPARARAVISDICAAWDLSHLHDPAQLVVSELVTNAVRHGSGRPRLTAVLRYRELHLIVRDESPEPPRRPTPPAERPAGGQPKRGLRMLDATARSWGYLCDGSGKAVWAVLRG